MRKLSTPLTGTEANSLTAKDGMMTPSQAADRLVNLKKAKNGARSFVQYLKDEIKNLPNGNAIEVPQGDILETLLSDYFDIKS